jgi:hypothetical protein
MPENPICNLKAYYSVSFSSDYELMKRTEWFPMTCSYVMYYKFGQGSVDSQSACKIEAIRFSETSTIKPIPYTVQPPETEFILSLN